ncbi:MAG: RHS repeat-associated core domain-containing protein [Phycisphaerales bacterium]
MVYRDRDNNTAWTSAADGTLEQRRYLCHNWRSDVSAVVTSGGALAECMKYSSYGVPFGLPAGDTDSDGDWDATDAAAIGGAYTILEDVELDGDVDAADATAANGAKSGYYNTGRGILSAISIRKGYAGYERAAELLGTKWHVRHRVLDSELGRWTRRDPLGYVDGTGLFQYTANPHTHIDSFGLSEVQVTAISHTLGPVNRETWEAKSVWRIASTRPCNGGKVWIIQKIWHTGIERECPWNGNPNPPSHDWSKEGPTYWEAFDLTMGPRNDTFTMYPLVRPASWTSIMPVAKHGAAIAYCEHELNADPPWKWRWDPECRQNSGRLPCKRTRPSYFPEEPIGNHSMSLRWNTCLFWDWYAYSVIQPSTIFPLGSPRVPLAIWIGERP